MSMITITITGWHSEKHSIILTPFEQNTDSYLWIIIETQCVLWFTNQCPKELREVNYICSHQINTSSKWKFVIIYSPLCCFKPIWDTMSVHRDRSSKEHKIMILRMSKWWQNFIFRWTVPLKLSCLSEGMNMAPSTSRYTINSCNSPSNMMLQPSN